MEMKLEHTPEIYSAIQHKTESIGFTMFSDKYTGSLLRTLITSKPSCRVLELGTGTGLALAWMVDGLDKQGEIISIENDSTLASIAEGFFNDDDRVKVIHGDGGHWLKSYQGPPFDLIFADAWPGKYSELDEALSLLKYGGFYVIDDMLPQPNWPEGHDKKAEKLKQDLGERTDLTLTPLDWSTGVIIAVKK